MKLPWYGIPTAWAGWCRAVTPWQLYMFGHIYCHSERHGFTCFRLVFSVSGDADGDNDTPFAFINNGSIIVSDANADATLQIVDVAGHIIS